MVSIGLAVKWTGTCKISELNVNEDVDYSSDEDISFFSKPIPQKNITKLLFLNQEVESEETILIVPNQYRTNFKQLLTDFKNKAATKIQKFFRNTILKKIKAGKNSYLLCEKTHKNYSAYEKSALKIQKSWKRYKMIKSVVSASSPRKLLAQFVSIGAKIRKINSVIEKISSKKLNFSQTLQSLPSFQSLQSPLSVNSGDHFSSPSNLESPVNQMTPEKSSNKFFNNRLIDNFHQRNFSLPDIIKEIIVDEYVDLSAETIPEIPSESFNFTFNSNAKINENQALTGTLVMKKNFPNNQKEKSVRKMNIDELQNCCEVDLEKSQKINTHAGSLASKFEEIYKNSKNFEIDKKELKCLYEKLINNSQ